LTHTTKTAKKAKSPNISLTMRRENTFTFKTVGANHCGTSDTMTVKYTFTCTCTADSIDERGFLFDQLVIDQFFQGITKTEKSCEKLSIWSARELFKIILKQNGKCRIKTMELTLSPAPYQASMTFKYEA
jgi:hypothetical protein